MQHVDHAFSKPDRQRFTDGHIIWLVFLSILAIDVLKCNKKLTGVWQLAISKIIRAKIMSLFLDTRNFRSRQISRYNGVNEFEVHYESVRCLKRNLTVTLVYVT